jgi:hypothetical protein
MMDDFTNAQLVRIENTENNNLVAPRSLNNRLIVESYVKGELRANTSNGFAFIEQKLNLKGLKVLLETKLSDGTLVPKGAVAYIKEETLHTQPWAQKALECDFIEGKFLIVDIGFVEFIAPYPKETQA